MSERNTRVIRFIGDQFGKIRLNYITSAWRGTYQSTPALATHFTLWLWDSGVLLVNCCTCSSPVSCHRRRSGGERGRGGGTASAMAVAQRRGRVVGVQRRRPSARRVLGRPGTPLPAADRRRGQQHRRNTPRHNGDQRDEGGNRGARWETERRPKTEPKRSPQIAK